MIAIARIGSLLLAAGALALAGCGGDSGTSASEPGSPGGPGGGLACTEIGCTSGLQLDLSPIASRMPAARRVRVCLDDRCRTFSPHDQIAMVSEPRLESKAEVRATVTVLDASGKTVMQDSQTARIVRVRPNGPHCEPVCFQVPLEIDARTLGLTPSSVSG